LQSTIVSGATFVLMWVMGVTAIWRSPDPTIVSVALFMATLPVIDIAIRRWRGRMTLEEMEQAGGALFGPWVGLFLVLGLLIFR
jgi:hypothetical protein